MHSWRDMILVKCCICNRPMGHHKLSVVATCVTCEEMKKEFPFPDEVEFEGTPEPVDLI